ncbi:alcohol dehydrogenase catalytic domain-containing protein [Tunturiibacter lichenicola]|uniref:alcohol dehydrogenase catalytic domain-containing protein n=1 Tax=Tunturiibacter lichenicola TaxID=2051959 RepID=UPI003D9AF793
MKALIFRGTGEPKSVLKLEEIPTPPLAPGEALVRLLLSPINASDLHMVRGRYGRQPELPASPGIEGVGIVEALGSGVEAPTVGTRVVFIDAWNTWREQIVCPADKLVPVPDGVDDSAAAASYINPLTAWALTISTHNLKEGDWLLQTAAASSVGKFVLKLAQQYRFKTINASKHYVQIDEFGQPTIRPLAGPLIRNIGQINKLDFVRMDSRKARFESAPLQIAYRPALTIQTFELSAVSPSSANRSPLGDGMAAKKWISLPSISGVILPLRPAFTSVHVLGSPQSELC